MWTRASFPAAAALALLAGAAAAQPGPDAASSWAAMEKCAGLANDAARHACSDEVLRQAGLLASPEARAVERRKAFGDEPKPKAAAAARRKAERQGVLAVGGGPAKAPAAPATSPAAGDDEDRISVTLQDVSMRGDGKLLLVTSEGVVWRPVESDAIRPMPRGGERMQIERTVFGGYMCKLGKWTAFRCTRAPDPRP